MSPEQRAQRLETLVNTFEGELVRQEHLAAAYLQSIVEVNPVWARITDALLSQNLSRLDTCFGEIQALVAEDGRDYLPDD